MTQQVGASAGASIEAPQPAPRRGLQSLSLKGRALRLLSGREYSRFELERKLAEHETQPGELVKALDELQAKGFISEERAAASVVHRRGARYGVSRVVQEMQRKGLGNELVSEAAENLRASEYERALEVWRKKYGHRSAVEPGDGEEPTAVDPQAAARERVRQMRFLQARGFAPEVIRRVVRDGAAGLDGLTGDDDM